MLGFTMAAAGRAHVRAVAGVLAATSPAMAATTHIASRAERRRTVMYSTPVTTGLSRTRRPTGRLAVRLTGTNAPPRGNPFFSGVIDMSEGPTTDPVQGPVTVACRVC